MGFLELLVTASMPVLKLLLVTGVGSFLATGHINILGEDARKHLNNVVFYVFNPALVSTNLSRTITWKKNDAVVAEMAYFFSGWFMPINILLTFVIGSVLGWIVMQMTKAPYHLRGLILGCCSAGNLGNMLLIIIPAMCLEKGSPFGAHDVCHTYASAYASLSMAIGAIFIWSYVYNIVRVTSSAIEDKASTSCHIPTAKFHEETANLIPKNYIKGTTSTSHYSDDHYADEQALVLSRSDDTSTRIKVPVYVKARHIFLKLSGAIDVKRLFAPSTIGVIVGFVIGVIPGIKKALIGEGAPLHVIQDSASLVGEGAIPSLTLIMGGNLNKGLHGSGVQFSLITGIIVIRYVILPVMGIAIVEGAVHLGLVHSDPLYRFTLLVQYAVPPAMNIGTITQLFGAGESECSVIFLWTYAFASVSLTLWSTFFMWLVLS